MRLKAVLAYDGSAYHGMAPQKNLPTVASCLQRAARLAFGREVAFVHASRTDAGVHALGQVVAFDVPDSVTPKAALSALNGALPEDIRVLRVRRAAPDFNPRFMAKSKTYAYFMSRGPHDPFAVRHCLQLDRPVDVGAMRRAASLFVGKRDFSSFTTTTRENRVRTVTSLKIATAGPMVKVTITGDGFLQHMVRMVVGTLLAVGDGKIGVDRVKALLASPVKGKSARTAPAAGLYLIGVRY